MTSNQKYLSIFSPSTAEERRQNFISYWEFSKQHSGELYEQEKNLEHKKTRLKEFRDHPVRSRRPLADPAQFYRNCAEMIDDPASLDRKVLLMTCIYKFARHEWAGISHAWDSIAPFSEAHSITQKISRVHLAEEFCHKRLFHEMLRTFQLDKVEWLPLGPVASAVYRLFPKLPKVLNAPPAFVSELLGITFYQHLERLFDEILADEPGAGTRCRELLHEIMVDELAHIGQRRNFLGPIGTRISQWIVTPLFLLFFRDIPEIELLFDTGQMIRDAKSFDFSTISPELMERTWVPSYCLA